MEQEFGDAAVLMVAGSSGGVAAKTVMRCLVWGRKS